MESSLTRRRAIIGIGAGALGAVALSNDLIASAQTATPPADQAESPLLDPKVGLIDAQKKGLEGNDGSSVREVELEYENDVLVWKIELRNSTDGTKTEIRLDANTGEILKTSSENDHDDDDD